LKRLALRIVRQRRDARRCGAGIDLVVRKGEMLAIIGPSGSGKSTLPESAGAIETPTTGHVFFEGTDVATLNDTNEHCCVVVESAYFPGVHLLPTLTAVENVALPLELDGIREASHSNVRLRASNWWISPIARTIFRA